jgi:hypothetical protein
MEWLRAALKDGPCPASALIDRARSQNFSKPTLDRAIKELGTKYIQGGVWMWALSPAAESETEGIPAP